MDIFAHTIGRLCVILSFAGHIVLLLLDLVLFLELEKTNMMLRDFQVIITIVRHG